MPRPPRLEFQGAFYHVYNRGNRRERLFLSDADYRNFEELLLDLAERLGLRLYAWCLMPNHFHLLVETPLANLSIFMQRLLTSYARHFNRTYRKVGHVFQGRYQAILCDREDYFLELVRYIHLNPYRVKTKGFVPEGGWPWSSHRYYLSGDEPMAVRPFIHEVLRRFGDDIVHSRNAYELFVAEGLEGKVAEAFYQVKGKRYLGSDRFVQETKERGQEPARKTARFASIELSELSAAVLREFQVSPAGLFKGSKNRSVSRAREALVFLGRRYGNHRPGELARLLNLSSSAISGIYRRAERLGATEKMEAVLLQLSLERGAVHKM